MSNKVGSKFKLQCEELPLFPDYDTKYIDDKMLRIWFESKFSQCHYKMDMKTSASNACTLIAILMAAHCHHNKIKISVSEQTIPESLIVALAQSMLMGNHLHDTLKTDGVLKNFNLTIPEAMKFASPLVDHLVEWKSLLSMDSLEHSLFKNISDQWIEWVHSVHYNQHPDLYVILICDNRTVLFVIQNISDTITLVDSHQHAVDKGALIVTVDRSWLCMLCQYYTKVIVEYYGSNPMMYELTCLYFKKTK